MPVSVKDYLNSMEKLSSSIDRSFKKKNDVSLDTKTQALLSQLIEAISFANSIDFRKKSLNKEVSSGGQTGKEVLKQLKAQEDLVRQLAEGQKLSAAQNKELTDVINKFYEVAGANEINYKKFAAQLERFALKQNMPEAVQTRLVNDARDAHMIGKEQKDSQGLIMPILKRIRNLLEDSRESSKQFGKKLFVTLDTFREDFLSAFDKFKEGLKDSGGFLENMVDALKMAGMTWMLFQGKFKDGEYKFGQLFKQINNVQTAFKAFAEAGKLGKYVKGPVKAIKDLVTGAKLVGKGLADIPKAFKGLKSFGKIAGTVGKGFAKGLGKGVLKKIPVIGTLMSIWMGIERWKQKDYTGALLEFGSGAAAMVPGIGTGISIALDLINLGRDTGFFKKLGEKSKEAAATPLGENLIMSLPLIGPIYGIAKAIGLFKQGDKVGGLKLIGKSLMSIFPGGAFIADALSTFVGQNFDIKPESSTNTPSTNSTKKHWWQRGSNEKGAGDSPIPASMQKGAGDTGPKVDFAESLGNAAIRRGGNRTTSSGVCALAVGDAFSSVVGEKEASKFRGNAWTWINSLKTKGAKWFNYAGIAGSDKELRSIPKGSIAVWNKQPAHPYGHIEIADGRGNLISDFKRPANLGLYRRNPAGIKPVIFTPKSVKVPKLSGSMNNPSGAEETSASSDISAVDGEEPATFESVMAAFNAFNEDIANSLPQTASASHASEGPTAPSIETMSAGTPQAATASSSAETAKATSKTAANSIAQQPQQVVQTSMGTGDQSTMDTEIRDTDLALLNSLLFQ